MKKLLALIVVLAMISQLIVLPVFAKQSTVSMTFDDVDISGGDVAIRDLNVGGVDADDSYIHHTLETLTFMNETAPTIAETGLFRADTTYNLTVYYPKNGTGYDTEQFKNMFPANTVFKYLGETSIKITSAVQNGNTYTIDYELIVDDDAKAEDAVVWLGLYEDDALVQLKQVEYDSNQAAIATAMQSSALTVWTVPLLQPADLKQQADGTTGRPSLQMLQLR